MMGSGQAFRTFWPNTGKWALAALPWIIAACNRPATEKTPELSDAARSSGPNTAIAATSGGAPELAAAPPTASSAAPSPLALAPVEKIDFQDQAMGTSVHFVAYTNAQ